MITRVYYFLFGWYLRSPESDKRYYEVYTGLFFFLLFFIINLANMIDPSYGGMCDVGKNSLLHWFYKWLEIPSNEEDET